MRLVSSNDLDEQGFKSTGLKGGGCCETVEVDVSRM